MVKILKNLMLFVYDLHVKLKVTISEKTSRIDARLRIPVLAKVTNHTPTKPVSINMLHVLR